MAALLVVIQVVTGLLLKFHYEPSPESAYNSILNLQESLLFGKMLRNIHHWSAIAFVWVAFLHMLRTAFTGAYRPPRDVTWITGLALLLLVVLSNFTGYLLPWDQLSYWAVTVGTSLLSYIPLAGEPIRKALLGGAEVGQPTLTNFFNLHTGVIPLLIIALMAWHFWRIRRAGASSWLIEDKESPMVDTRPHLVNREFVVAITLLAAIFLISSLFDAPLRERANPAFSPNPAKGTLVFHGTAGTADSLPPVVRGLHHACNGAGCSGMDALHQKHRHQPWKMVPHRQRHQLGKNGRRNRYDSDNHLHHPE
jgi:quinol-cytochrome oxidoreductase complex cytochrome b subunit